MDHPLPPIPSLDPPPSAEESFAPLARPLGWADSALPRADHPLLLIDLSPRQALRDVVWVAIALVAAELLLGQFLSLLMEIPEPEMPEYEAFQRELLIPVLSVRTLLVFSFIFIVLRRRGQSAHAIGLGGPTTPYSAFLNAVLGISCTGAAYAMMFIWLLTSSYFWPDWIEAMGENAAQLVRLIPAMHPGWFVPLMLTVGMYEEVLFRGFLLTRLRRAFGAWTPAVVVTTVLFTLAHVGDQELAAMPIIAGLSVIFSIATIWRRSLWPAIIGHFLFNLLQMIGLYYTHEEWR